MWSQPVLTANGTIGEDDFAVQSGGGANSDAYSAFDDDVSSYVNKMNKNAWIIFYSKSPLKINSVTVQSEGFLPAQGKLQYSDDNGTTWTDCGTWTDETGLSTEATADCNQKFIPHSYWRLYSLDVSIQHPSRNADIGNVIIDVIEGNICTLSCTFDTARKVEKTQEANFSLCRKIVKSAEITADTKRKINRSVKLLVGTLREVTSANLTPVEKYFDAVRNVINAIVASGDAERNVVKSLEVINDTERKIVQSIEVDFDAVRKIEKSTSISADTKRLTSNAVEVYFDAVRDVNKIWRLGYPFFSSASAYQDSAEIEVPATNEVWIKFNLLTNECLGSTRIGIMEDKDFWNLFGLTTKKETCRLWYGDFLSFDYGDFISLNHTLPKNANECFLIHMKSGVSDGLIEIFSGENLIGSYSGNVNDGDDFANFDYYGVKGTEGVVEARNFVISNAPLTVADNARFEVDVSFSTLRIINTQGPKELYFDTCRRVDNIWRIENYGTADLTDNSEAETLEVGYSKSRTGYAYRHGEYAYYDVPPSQEVWIKLDVYFDSEALIGDPDFKEIAVGAMVEIQPLKNHVVFVGKQPSYSLINVNLPYNQTHNYDKFENYIGAEDFENPIEYNRLYRILVHIKSDSSEGTIEYWLDNGKYLSYVGNVHNGEDFTRAYISILRYPDYSPLISNVIISNAPVGLYEDVAEVGGEVVEVYPTVRKILNPPLTWTYENYGTKDLILTEGRNYENLDFTQSRTGSAFTTLEKAKTFQTDSTYEIWAKFDFYVENIRSWYIPNESDGINWGLKILNLGLNQEEYGSEIPAGIEIYSSGSSPSYDIWGITDTGEQIIIDGFSLCEWVSLSELNDLNSCLLYMKSDATDGVIKLWINGDLKFYYIGNVNNGNALDNISLYSLYDFREVPATSETVAYFRAATLFSNIKISNSELEISRNIELSHDTERRLTSKKELYFDTKRTITYAGIWRYENYGTANLLEVEGTTVDVGKAAAIYQSGFYQTQRYQKCFDIDDTKEIWIKFDVYFNGANRWRVYQDTGNNTTGICSQTNRQLDFWVNASQVQTFSNELKINQRQTLLLHMISDSKNGLLECWSDGVKLGTYTGNVYNGNDFDCLCFQSDGSGTFFSNVIISNAEIGLNENTKLPLIGTYDFCRSVTQPCEDFFDAKRNIVKSQFFYADAARDLKYLIDLYNDTCRDVMGSLAVHFDTARTMPHKLEIMPIPVKDFSNVQNRFSTLKKNSPILRDAEIIATPSTDNITTGTQSCEVNLVAQQLTDQLSYSSVNPAAIMEQVHGQYLDYEFNVRIERSSKRGAVYSFKCCSDIDEVLYRQLEYQIPDDEQWHKVDSQEQSSQDDEDEEEAPMSLASTHISHIAENMGKTPLLFFPDFVSTVDVNAGGVTYQDLISNIFGWTSRIPNMLINVFLRGDKMFVVQRGHEPNTIDLTETKHSLPNVDCELVRTAWGATLWSKTETREKKAGYLALMKMEEESGSGGGSRKNNYTFSGDDLVSKSETVEGDTKTTTYYEYETLKGGKKFLRKEHTTIYEKGSKVDEKITYHTPLGQGQVHTVAHDSDGEYLGGVVGQSTGDHRVSPKSKSRSYIFKVATIPQERTIYGLTFFDNSFPVHGDEKLEEITAAINWLNRKTKETISMSVYDYPHLIDFTDKIIFDGNEYFLEANTAVTTSRIINRQDVSFVRWY